MKRQKATDAKIRSLKPKAGQRTELWFEGGLGIRVGTAGNPPIKTWQTMCRVDRKLTRLTLGRYPAVSVHEAGRVCSRIREAIAKGEDYKPLLPGYVSPEKEAAQGYSVRHLADDYLRLYARPNKKSAGRDETYLNNEIIPLWGGRAAHEIVRRDVALLLEGIASRNAPITSNRVRSLLSKMFEWAVGTGRLEVNPVIGIPKAAKENDRDRTLSDAEIKSLWNALGEPESPMSSAWRIAIKLALILGQRLAEIVEAPWHEFNFEPGKETWTIPGSRAKNGRSHTIPLPSLAVELLGEARTQLNGEQYVFPGMRGDAIRPQSLTSAFSKYRKQLGLDGGDVMPTFHDLRRTLATRITQLGFSRLVADKILNHVDSTVGGRYDRHDYMGEMTAALAAWSERVLEIVHGREADTNVVPIRSATE